ncbi:MAG: deoxyribose-phosphate aldolase [Bacteroidota bacterium]
MVQELAKMIDHSLLHPTMTDQALKSGCELALHYEVASVCIKPYAVSHAKKWLAGSSVAVGTVIGFPHGNSTTAIKAAETIQACKDGATEIDMVVNIGRVLGKNWTFVSEEIGVILGICRKHGALLKVIFENDFLPEDLYKIELCKICSTLNVDFVKTSTGYGMVKGEDGRYGYHGATTEDLQLMRANSASTVQVKAAGGVRTLDDILKVRDLGVTRVGASATQKILDEAITRFGGELTPYLSASTTEGY